MCLTNVLLFLSTARVRELAHEFHLPTQVCDGFPLQAPRVLNPRSLFVSNCFALLSPCLHHTALLVIFHSCLNIVSLLRVQSRKDSQGICFLGKLKFEDFVGHHLGENPGVVRDFHTNEELGEHKGLWFHTIGQRKGLGEATKK